ncbi:MAG: S-methyl-5'-thioadenosine phosphorylase [Planctomycetota bacterium]
MAEVVLGVIGGSGLYEIDGLENVRSVRLETPFGDPSDEYVQGELEGRKVVFLPRHGRGHRIGPSQLNFRANIFGMKKLGVNFLLSISAVGSMREDIAPGDLVVVDQFIDWTRHRPGSFFEDGIIAHVLFADPVCPTLAGWVYDAGVEIGAKIHKGGTYICMEGPQFSTRAESKLYRSWGVDVIGMTNVQEAKLAREAEMSFSTLALATDYDCWHESEEDVSVEAVLAIVRQNVDRAKALIRAVVAKLPADADLPAHHALEHAIMTDPSRIPKNTLEALDILIGHRLPKE